MIHPLEIFLAVIVKMRTNRFYEASKLPVGEEVALSKEVSNHISRVLRLKDGAEITLFNGDGSNYLANVTVAGKSVTAAIINKTPANNESALSIHLGQAISRGERMDFTLQKSVELGVLSITPLISERVQFRYDEKRLKKKMSHWQKIIESACEQSGRAVIPYLNSPMSLSEWLQADNTPGLLFVPGATTSLMALPCHTNLRLLVGPEGGLSDAEVEHSLNTKHFTAVNLGPRILRTETAALAAISILQAQFGDI
jgi:16S rRNA (uracil1498-N3)-methyltransferase